ncbi:MAG: alcohol dehydrogenase class IV [Granulosicoccus sp.]|jgi:alcohol dehydrogenase class IV
MNANWNYPTQVLVGAGRISELPRVCFENGIRHPLLVTDPGLASLPLVQDVLSHCRAEGLDIECFSHIKPNPTGANIEDGIAAFKQGVHDGVIAMGGGSGLDAGKAIAVTANQSCSFWDLEDIGDNWQKADAEKIAPLIGIPTTAGTGSEVGRAALIVNEAEQRKVIIFHPAMMPGHVILDPELTVGLPPLLTAATGMDALSHSLEAYCSLSYHPMAEGIAVEGIRIVKEFLPTAVKQGGNIDARMNMLVASTMGATSFQRGLGAMHALAHPLGALFDAHHGMLNAVLMPYVLKANFSAIAPIIPRLAKYLDLEPDFEAFMNWVLSLRLEVGIPNSLDDVIDFGGEKPAVDLNVISRMATEDPSAGTNPIQFEPAQYLKILEDSIYGRL